MKPDKPVNRERIEHILKCIQNIQSFTEGYDVKKFEDDVKVYYASLYQFAVIGEAISKIDDEILTNYDYPWHKVKSFRNFIDAIKIVLEEEF